MGNQSSGGSGPVDVTKLYAIDAVPLDQHEGYGGFTLFRGTRKRDNAPVLIFRCVKAQTTSAGLCSNSLRQAKRLRHPLILNLFDGVETETDVFLATENATPLAVCLSEITKESQRAWGIRCLANVLSFLNEKCRLVHGNVTPWSVFVTPGGDWKLFGLELLDMDFATPEGSGMQVVLPPLLKQAQWIPVAQYKSPERRRNDFKAMEAGPIWSIDSWALGNVLLDVFEGRVQLSSSGVRHDPAQEADRLLPSNLRQIAKQLLSVDSRSRLIPSAVIRSEFFSDLFVKSMVFLEELQLKSPEKREAYFKSLVSAVPGFPLGSVQYKVIPAITQAISFEAKSINAANMAAASGQPPPAPASVNVLIGMLDALLSADNVLRSANKQLGKDSAANIDTAIADLFACNDRIVRVGLLQRIEKIVTCISPEAINHGFDQICAGFSDATPVVRELTIKAMIPLVPRLNDLNKNDKLMRYLAKLQSDPEHAIRTNCVVCLGLIAPQLSADARRKTLTASFARALKDPFVHARAAGLRGLINAHKLMGLDKETLATKILPTICPLLVDQAKEVRALAFETMNALTKTLQEEIKAAESVAERAGVAAPPTEKAPEGLLSKAVSFASSFAASSSKPETAGQLSQGPPSQPSQPAVYKPPPMTAKKDVRWDEDEDETGRTVTAKQGPARPKAWDDDGSYLLDDDPDNFFSKPQVKALEPTKPQSTVPVKDIFALEDPENLKKPVRLAKKTNKPVVRDLLTDDDIDFFNQPLAAKPTRATPAPVLPIKQTPVPTASKAKSSISADDNDFFASLMSQPLPKKKT